MVKTRAALEHWSQSVPIHSVHIETLHSEHRDALQHIAQSLQDGEPPVGAVAAAAHGPGDEDTSRYRRSEDDGGEALAAAEG